MKTVLALSFALALVSGACLSSELVDPDGGTGGGAGGSAAGSGGRGGQSGSGGAAGTGGQGGTAGTAGSSAGAGGRGGQGGAGAAGSAGAAGAIAGRGGQAGTAGAGGAGGSAAGAGGRGGQGGTAGTAAAGGAAGTSAGRGVGGQSATAGSAAGAGGRGGQGGTAGTAGASGAAGASGTGGAASWQTGYTATMFGNISAGDCAGVTNFSDMTSISGANCTYQGVTIDAYMSGVANNASFYGAPGDQSSIWMGPQCTCQPGQSETSGKCPSPPACAMEQNCGKCFEVKCDPNGTGTYSNGDTRMGAMYCNPNQSVVIEIIDACPHNHPSNTWWCTNQRRNHIDISCSAMKGIIGNANNAGNWGWVNVQVRSVACGVGLGVKTL